MKFLSQINVNTEYTLPIVDGTNGQVLATDGNGNVYWGSISVGATNLDGLTDVILTSPSSGQLLRYGIPPGSGETSPVWYNFTPNYLTPSSSIDNLGDVTITSATSGQILQYNGTAWVNTTLSTVEYVSKVQHLVKAGVAITKGQAVYVTSADGTNMIVGLASNAAESTSSKVIGLAASNAAINDQIFVVTEGLIAGLNTSTATAGDPVWLGTGGNLIFGLLNKPVAPAHLVYIGVVTRVQQNNGEIFVNVQNGFELHEIHDALIVSPTAGQLLRRDSDNLWKNWTPNYLTAESDTLATVTARGATTTGNIVVNGEISLPSFIRLTNAGANNAYISESWGINLNGASTHPIQVRSASLSVGYTLGAGTSYGSGNLFVSDKIGVNTTAPTKALDVVGSGIVASFGSAFSTGSFAGIHFGYSETQYGNDNYKKSALVFERTDNHIGQGSNASGKIHFLLNNAGGTSATSLSHSVLTIDSNANGTAGTARVGIGRTSPFYALDVNGQTNSTSFVSTSILILDADLNQGQQPQQGDPANKVASFRWAGNEQGYIDTDAKITFAGFKTPTGTASQFLKANGTVDSSVYITSAALSGYATQAWVNSNFYNQGQIDDFFSGAEPISGYNKSNWDAAYNDKVNSASFNTTNGVLTLTQQDGGTVTVDLDGRYLTSDTDAQTLTWDGGSKTLGITNGNDVILSELATEDFVTSQGYVTSSHTHTIANVTGLQTALDGKMPYYHTAISGDPGTAINGVTRIYPTANGPIGAGHFTVFTALQDSVNYGWQFTSVGNDAYFRSKDTTWGGWQTIATQSWVQAQGYITGYTETDTLATVTARGATTSIATTFSNTLTVSGNTAIFKASSVTADTTLPTKRIAEFAGIYNSGSNGHQMFISSTASTGPWEINQTKTWGGILSFGVSTNGTEITRKLYVTPDSVGVNVYPTSGDQMEVAGALRVHTGNNWDGVQIYADGQAGYIRGRGDEIGLHIRSEYGNVLLASDRGSVAVGKSTALFKLDVGGNARFDNEIYVGGVLSSSYGPRTSQGNIHFHDWNGNVRARINTVDGVTSVGNRKLSLGILDINSGGVPEIKINTKIPFALGGADFTVNIKGFQYGGTNMVSLSIGWHYYLGQFYSETAISNGSFSPTITLGVEPEGVYAGCVVIHLSNVGYWPKLYVESVYSSAYADDYVANWSWSDAAIDGLTDISVLAYKPLETSITGSAGYATNAGNSTTTSQTNFTTLTLSNAAVATQAWVQTQGYLTSLPAHTHTIANVTGLQTALDGKAASSHTHSASDITSGTISTDRLPKQELGISIVGNFGQWQNHGAYQNLNTDVAYWGWNFAQGNVNAPHQVSSQWYRGRFSLGDEYGLGTSPGDYWMEIAIPRYNQGDNAGNLFVRTCENGSINAWQGVRAAFATDADTLDGQHGSYYQPASTAITTSNIGSQSVATSTQTYRAIIEDTRSGQRTPNDYDDYRASWEFTNQIPGLSGSTWWSLMTVQGWHNGYSAWQIIGPSDAGPENWYLRVGNNTTWGTARRIWHAGDFSSTNVTNWNTAYGWGNHADAPYWNVSSTDPKDVESTLVTFRHDVTILGTLTESSSIRFKENIIPLEPSLDKVNQLEAVSYNKVGIDNREIGLIAEDVAELFPEVVTYNEEGQPQGIQYQRLSVILLKAMQEQNAVIAALTERVNKLENK